MLLKWKRRRVLTQLLCALMLGLIAGPSGVLAAVPKAITTSNNAFAIDLYAQLAKSDRGNLFFSPYSAFSALLMTYAGAEGQTRQEMRKVLRLLIDDKRARQEFTALLQQLRAANKDVTMDAANSVWVQKPIAGFEIDPAFVRMIQQVYDGQVTALDFAKAPDAARRLINRWVSKRTRGKIKELLKAGSIQRATRLVLTNAIYFKGQWQFKFHKAQTTDKPFFLGTGGTVSAKMMRQLTDLSYGEWATHQLLELPYKGKRVSMVVILPKKGVTLAQLEAKLTAPALAGWIAGMSTQKVSLQFPKFKSDKRLDLKRLLKALGLKLPFSSSAQFMGFLPPALRAAARKLYRLYISDVIQQAVIEVSEEGTIAAVATAVIVGRMGLTSVRPRPVIRVFNANRPFIYLIRDVKTGAILFMGRIANPTQSH